MPPSNTILILIPYFGDLPWYFPFFLHSCRNNPSVDLVLFTDSSEQHELPPNVRIIHTTLEDIRGLASKKIGYEVRIDSAYKLCDLKPAYGLIFEDYTKGYDFWAISDIDIIYGDLRGFFTDELMSTHDFINVRHDYTTGCFMLIRNNTMMNNIFRQSRDHKKVFTTSSYLGFDELNFRHCELSEGRSLEEIDTDIECFTHLIKNAARQQEIAAWFDFILLEGVPGKIKYTDGRLIYDNQLEAALYHLYWLKKVYRPKRRIRNIPSTYHISPKKIYFTRPKNNAP